MVTAGTEILVGQPSKVGNGLRTIGLNIAALAAETDKYVAANGKVNISLRDSQGEMKSTYEVLKELYEGVEGQSVAWDELASVEQAAIGETLAGKNQFNVLTSVMTNFESAINATATAMDSAGSATKENAAYMDSLEAKVGNLKNTFQELSTSVIDSDLVKGILDLANTGLELLSTDVGVAVTQFTLLSGVLTGFLAIAGKVGTKFVNMGKLFSAMGDVGKAASAASATGNAIGGIAKAAGSASGFVSKLSGALSKIGTFAGPIAMLAGALVTVGFAAKKSMEEATAEHAIQDEIDETTEAVSELEQKIAELEGSGASASVLAAYNEQLKQMKNNIASLETEKLEAILTASPTSDRIASGQKTRATITGEMMDTELYIEKAITQWNNYQKAVDKALSSGDFEQIAEANDDLLEQEGVLTEYWDTMTQLYAKTGELPERLKNAVMVLNGETISALDFFQDHFGTTIEAAAESINSLSGQLSGLGDVGGYFDILSQSVAEFAENGQLSFESIMQLNEAFSGLEGWDEILEGLVSGSTTFEEFQEQVTNLAYTMLEAQLGVEGLANANVDMIASFLESKGVADADARALELVTTAQKRVTENPANTDASQTELNEEKSAAEDAAGPVEGVKDAQQEVTNNPADTSASQGAFSSLISAAQNCYNRVSSIWNSLKGIISKIGSGAQKVLGYIIPGFGGGKAQGGKVNRAGQYWVGEQGPEIVTLPKGAVVTSNKDISGNVGYKVEKEDVKGGYAQGTGRQSIIDVSDTVGNLWGDKKPSGSKPSTSKPPSSKKPSSSSSSSASKKKTSTAKSSTKAIKDENDAIKEQNDLYKEQMDILDHKLYLMEKNGATEQEQIAHLRQMQKKAHDEAESYRKQGLDDESEYIMELQKEWWGYEEDILKLQQDAFDKRLKRSEDYIKDRNYFNDWGADNEIDAWRRVMEWMDDWYEQGLIDYEYYLEQREDALDNYIEAERDAWKTEADNIEKALNYVAELAQREIDKLEEQKDAINDKYDAEIEKLEKQNEETNEQIELQEKLDALAKARTQKLYVYKDGRFQYIQDTDAISEAQKELDRYKAEKALEEQIEQLEKNRDEELKILEEKIKYWQDYVDEYGSAIDEVNDLQDRLLAEQILGIKLEGDNWEKRLGNLQDYVDRYIQLMQQLENENWQTGQDENTVVSGPNAEGGRGTPGTAWVPGVGVIDVDIKDGKTQTKGLPVGTIVSTAGGNYKITGVNEDGSYQSEYVGGGKHLDVAPGGNAPEGATIGDIIHTAGGDYEIVHPYTPGAKYNPINGLWSKLVEKNAKGTLSSKGGMSLVGEEGPELRLLNTGDSILPSDVTKNLWDWGKMNPIDLLSNLPTEDKGFQLNMSNVDLSFPSIKNKNDVQEFVQSLVNFAYQTAYKRG